MIERDAIVRAAAEAMPGDTTPMLIAADLETFEVIQWATWKEMENGWENDAKEHWERTIQSFGIPAHLLGPKPTSDAD